MTKIRCDQHTFKWHVKFMLSSIIRYCLYAFWLAHWQYLHSNHRRICPQEKKLCPTHWPQICCFAVVGRGSKSHRAKVLLADQSHCAVDCEWHTIIYCSIFITIVFLCECCVCVYAILEIHNREDRATETFRLKRFLNNNNNNEHNRAKRVDCHRSRIWLMVGGQPMKHWAVYAHHYYSFTFSSEFIDAKLMISARTMYVLHS